MASILPEIDKKTSPSELANASLLDDKLPEWCKTTWAFSAYTLVIGLIFAFVSYLPLWHTDLWGHLAYGRYLWNHGFPTTEPLLPLAEGMRFVDTAWLSQLIGFGVYETVGPVGLRFLHAMCIAFCLALVAKRLHQKTGRLFPTLAGLFAISWLWFDAMRVIRPQIAGVVMFTALLFVLTGRWRKGYWIAVPAMFALWANLHGSFVVGITLLGAFTIGRAIDVFRRAPLEKRWKMMFADPVARRCFLLTELAAVAALLNPYGLELYLAIFSLSGNANVHMLSEWEPLTIRILPGWGFAAVAVAFAFLYRRSRRRISAIELLTLIGLGVATCWTYRFIVWFAPVAGFWLALHAASAFKRREVSFGETRSLWSVVSIGLAWICFAFTPAGLLVIHGTQLPLEKQVSPSTPLAAAEYLKANPVPGMIFTAPISWGDYLMWSNPETAKVMSTSHVHMLPPRIWDRQLRIQMVTGNWASLLDWFGINAVVVEKGAIGGKLAAGLRSDAAMATWKLGYEDDVSVVFVRREPIVTGVDLRKVK